MNIGKRVIQAFIIISIVALSSGSSLAITGQTAFITDKRLADKEASQMIERIILKKTDQEYKGLSNICSFDVNQQQDLAIGFASHHINIFNPQGVFQYSLQFYDLGSYVLEYDRSDNNLIIYSYRSDLVFKIGSDGQIITVAFAARNSTNRNHLRELERRTQLSVAGSEYHKFSKLPFPFNLAIGYARFVWQSPVGEKKTLYDRTWGMNASASKRTTASSPGAAARPN